MASISALIDPFTVTPPNSSLWTLTSGSTTNTLTSVATYDWTGAAAFVKVKDYGSSTRSVWFYAFLDSNSYLVFYVNGGNLSWGRNNAGSFTSGIIGATTDVNFKWLRIREAGGSVLWETSPDGITWTTRNTVAPGIAITALSAILQSSEVQPVGTGGVFDSFNVAPGGMQSIIGTPAAVTTTTITLPTHAPGDLIFIGASTSANSAITTPTAGGTVPTWVNIDASNDGNGGIKTAYAIATAANHTSGTWTNAGELAVIVIRGQSTSPIGGHIINSSTSTGPGVTAPSITLRNSTGTALQLYLHSGGFSSWSTAPAGYTRRVSANGSSHGTCLNTKDITTSDGSVVQNGTWAGLTTGTRSATVEVLAVAVVPKANLYLQAIPRASYY